MHTGKSYGITGPGFGIMLSKNDWVEESEDERSDQRSRKRGGARERGKGMGAALMHAIFSFHSQQSQYNLWAEGSGG